MHVLEFPFRMPLVDVGVCQKYSLRKHFDLGLLVDEDLA
jgi:hypothetical protein